MTAAPAPAPPARPARKGAALGGKLEIADDGGGGAAPSADSASNAAPGAPRSSQHRAPAAAELVKQAEAAAARGDCAAVRTLAAQIRKLEPSYPAQPAASAAVKRCLK